VLRAKALLRVAIPARRDVCIPERVLSEIGISTSIENRKIISRPHSGARHERSRVNYRSNFLRAVPSIPNNPVPSRTQLLGSGTV
jgi:hypothetical protein